jgi:hypothetical protein
LVIHKICHKTNKLEGVFCVLFEVLPSGNKKKGLALQQRIYLENFQKIHKITRKKKVEVVIFGDWIVVSH